MIVFSQRLRPRAGLGAHADIETATGMDFLRRHRASGQTLSQRASEEEISGETVPMPFLWGDLAAMLWKLQAAFDQFMYLCIGTCFGLKTMPGKKRGVHYVYRILGVILSANFCARWVVPAFERKFLFLSSGAKFIACGIREVPFWDGVYGSPRTQDSISWLPYVTHICLSDRLWKGMTLQLKQG